MAEEDDAGSGPESGDVEILLRLPEELRSAFKDPLGQVYTDAEELIAEAGDPIVAVGDVVTHHLRSAGRDPDVALVDGMTERREIDDQVRSSLGSLEPSVTNPAATLTAGLLSAIREAIDSPERTTIVVDGEEDLATLPAAIAAPDGASVVYGQPGEGMVLVTVDDEVRRKMWDLFVQLDGDVERAADVLDATRPDGDGA